MNIVMSTLELKEVLNTISSLKLGKNSLSVLTYVRIVGKDSKISIIGNNLKTNIIGKITNYSLIDFDTMVHFDSLFKAVKSLETGNCYLSLDEAKCSLKSYDEKETYKLSTMLSDAFPDFNTNDLITMQIQNSLLQQTLKNNLKAVSTDETRYFLNGILFENDDCKNIKLVSTDGRRLNYNEIETWTSEKTFENTIVSPEGLTIYSKLKNLNDYADVYINSAICSIKNDIIINGSTFSIEIQCKVIEGQFPQYSRIVSDDRENKITLNVKDLLKVSKKIKNFVDTRSKLAVFSIAMDNKLYLQAEDNLSIEIASDISLTNLKTAFNITFLLDILTTTKNESIDIYIGDGYKPMYLIHDNGLSMIQPIQLD